MIVASSDKAYGWLMPGTVATELTSLDPVHPYDVSKASADFIARSYGLFYGAQTAVLRCGNIYGPGDRNWQRIIPGALRAGIMETELVVRSDGTLVREYNFIDDIVDAYLSVADGLLNLQVQSGRAWLVSDPTNRLDVKYVIGACEAALGRPIRRVYTNQAQDEGEAINLEPGAIVDELGWKPATSIHDGIRRTADWMIGNFASEWGLEVL